MDPPQPGESETVERDAESTRRPVEADSTESRPPDATVHRETDGPPPPSGPPTAPLLPVADVRFGEALIAQGILTPAQLLEAHRTLEAIRRQGIILRLGEVLVQKGMLTQDDLLRLLPELGRHILHCPRCRVDINVADRPHGGESVCPTCRGMLVAPAHDPMTATRVVEGTTAASLAYPTEPMGRPFGRYQLLQELGRGGMGVVWKAWDPSLHRVVALKQILAGETDPHVVERFHREARAAARLRHPQIASVHDVGMEEGHPYFTTDFIEGRSLADRMESGRLESREAVELVRSVAATLHYAHEQGIVHRDVKPANILLDASGRPHVVDFGLALEAAALAEPARNRLTASGALVGTPRYWSPEQAAGRSREQGPATDQFSLGVILYELITGKAPFDGETLGESLQATLREDPAPPRRLEPQIGRDLETVCLQALEKEPGRRYASLGELAEDLARTLAGEPIRARRDPLAGVRRLLRSRGGAIAGAASVVLGLALVAAVVGARAERARSVEAALVAARAHREAGRVEPARDEFHKALALDAANTEAQAGFAWADGEARGRIEALQAAQRDAEGALEKAKRVSAVFRRWEKLVPALRELEAAHDDPRRAVDPAHWVSVEEFVRDTPADPASQATAQALAGWALHASGREEEGLLRMREAAALDPDVPYGALMEALAWFARIVERQPLPAVGAVGAAGELGIAFGPAPGEPPELAAARLALESLLAAARGARVWGRDGADDFAAAMGGIAALQSGDYARADAEFTRALAATDVRAFEPDLLLARAKARYLRREFASGLRDLEQALQVRPDRAEVHRYAGELGLGLAAAAAVAGADPIPSLEAATRAFGEALARDPRLSHAWNGRGGAQRLRGDVEARRGDDPRESYDRSIADYTAALELLPTVESRVNRASALEARGSADAVRGSDPRASFAEAVAEYGRAIEIAPGFAGAYAGRAAVLETQAHGESERGGDPREAYARALADHDVVLRLAPDSALAYNNRGALRLRLGEYERAQGRDPRPILDAARADFAESLRRQPDFAMACNNQGRAWFVQARAAGEADPRELLDRAVAEYDQALRRAPRLALARHNRASALLLRAQMTMALGRDPRPDLERVIADADAALTVQPGLADAYLNRATARAILAQAEDGHGGDPLPHLDRAVTDFGEALRLDPGHAGARMGRGNAEVMRGQVQVARGLDPRPALDRAIADAGEAIGRAPALADPYLSRAIAYRWRAEAERSAGADPSPFFARAVEDLRACLDRAPRSWQAAANLGQLYEAMGRLEEAVRAFESALELSQGRFPALQEWLDAARKRAGAGREGK